MKATKKKVPRHVQNCKKANNTKETNGSSARSSSLQSNSKKASAGGSGQGSSSAVQTAADERRLRKLKVFLKSVSYNGCEGASLPNLNDLYMDQLLVDEFPCKELSKTEEFKCNPTPFILASCFNRNQVKDNSDNNMGNKTTKRAPRKANSTPRKRNTQIHADSPKTSKQHSPLQLSKLQQMRSPLSAEKTNPARRLFTDEQCDKKKNATPRKEGSLAREKPAPGKISEKKEQIKSRLKGTKPQ